MIKVRVSKSASVTGKSGKSAQQVRLIKVRVSKSASVTGKSAQLLVGDRCYSCQQVRAGKRSFIYLLFILYLFVIYLFFYFL